MRMNFDEVFARKGMRRTKNADKHIVKMLTCLINDICIDRCTAKRSE